MKKLSREQMKNVMGGNPPSASCSANCPGGESVSLSCGENSTCIASDSVGVRCIGACTDKVCCYGGTSCIVEA